MHNTPTTKVTDTQYYKPPTQFFKYTDNKTEKKTHTVKQNTLSISTKKNPNSDRYSRVNNKQTLAQIKLTTNEFTKWQ